MQNAAEHEEHETSRLAIHICIIDEIELQLPIDHLRQSELLPRTSFSLGFFGLLCILTLWFVVRDLQNEKRDQPHLPHSPLLK